MALSIVFLFSFDLTWEVGQTNYYQSTAPEDGNILRVIQRHIGEGHVIALADGTDLETSFKVGFVPAWESWTSWRRLEMSRHQVPVGDTTMRNEYQVFFY